MAICPIRLPSCTCLAFFHNSVMLSVLYANLFIFFIFTLGLNCDMPVNGLISPSIPSNHGTFASGTSSTSHPAASNFDYLWKFPKSPVLKDCHGPSLPKVNGSASPVSNGPFHKGNSQEAWENSASSHQTSLLFNGQDLCNFSNINVKVAAAANGTHCYPTSPQAAPLLIFGMQPPSPSQCQDEEQEMQAETTETLGDKEELGDMSEDDEDDDDVQSGVYKCTLSPLNLIASGTIFCKLLVFMLNCIF